MNHDNDILFNNVARATIPIIDKFNVPELANTVNVFTKINHDNAGLFNNAAT